MTEATPPTSSSEPPAAQPADAAMVGVAPPLSSRRLVIAISVMGGVTLALLVVCTLLGEAFTLDIGILKVRLARVLAAAVVGAGLAPAGMAMQALLRNPLAEPYVLGLSSGAGIAVLIAASVAEALVIPGWAVTPVAGLVGALVSSGVVYLISQRRGRIDPLVMLLAGVIINVFNGALIMLVLQFVKQEQMIEFIGWGMGQIPDWLFSKPGLLVVATALVLGCWAGLFLLAHAFNVLGLGDEVARSMGVNVVGLRLLTFLIVSIMTAAAVAIAGPVGFVGLIVPHICRLIVGPDHRLLVIVSGFAGACFLMTADTACRMISHVSGVGEMPVGVVTALAGGPFFVYLLRRRLRGDAW